ncbi:hypothetical protein V1504DRAFT_364033, partial [Lipomyces starkeyi]
TRGNRQNYLALNDGYDNEVLQEDQLSSPTPGPSSHTIGSQEELDSFLEISDVEILPSRISLAVIPDICCRFFNYKKRAWFLAYFTQKEIPHQWYEKKYKERRSTDTEIQCSIVDERTGIVCNWRTSDSKRHSSTSNMTNHLLRKHSIRPRDAMSPEPVKAKSRATLPSLWGGKDREDMTHQQRLERNILRWVISNKQAFTVIE